jgi:membrane protein DedA with SNARE-associated domain
MNEITQSLVAHGALVVFAAVFVDQAGLPLPSAAWLLAAGALSASGKMSASVAIGMSVAACLIADSLWFYVGRRGGDRVLSFLRRWSWGSGSFVARTKGLVDRHGLRGLVISKFLPGLGAVLPPLAGALGVNAVDFLWFDSLGALVYGAFYTGAGFLFHNQLRQALAVLRELGLSALLFALVLVATCIAFNWVRRRPCFLGCARDSGAEVPGSHPSMSEWSI